MSKNLLWFGIAPLIFIILFYNINSESITFSPSKFIEEFAKIWITGVLLVLILDKHRVKQNKHYTLSFIQEQLERVNNDFKKINKKCDHEVETHYCTNLNLEYKACLNYLSSLERIIIQVPNFIIQDQLINFLEKFPIPSQDITKKEIKTQIDGFKTEYTTIKEKIK